MRPGLSRPPRAQRSRPVKPGLQAPGVEKGTQASGKPTRAPRATGPDEAWHPMRGHGARQRGAPPATTRHTDRCKATPAAGCHQSGQRAQHATNQGKSTDAKQQQPPSGWTCARPAANPPPAGYRTAAVRMDECAPGSVPGPCWLRTASVRGTSVRPEGTQPLPDTNSLCLEGRVCALQGCPATHSTTHRASTPVNRSQVAHNTAHPTQHAGQAHR